MYKGQDQEKYKTTTIRMRVEDYEAIKDLSKIDHRSVNYLINRILIEYIIRNNNMIDFKIFN